MVDGCDRLADDEARLVELDVLPAQSAELGSAEAGHGGESEHWRMVGARGELEERAQLFGCPYLHLGRASRHGGGWRSESRDIACHEALAFGIVQRLADHGVHVADRPVRQRPPASGAPDRREACVEAIEIDRAHVLDRDVAEFRFDVDADQAAVAGDRRWAAARDDETGDPVGEVGPERDATRSDEGTALQLGERLVECGLRVLPCPESALADLLPTAVLAADVDDEAPCAAGSLDAPGPAHPCRLRDASREDALVLSTVVCTKDRECLHGRLHAPPHRVVERGRWSPFGHGDHESRHAAADLGGRRGARAHSLTRRNT